MKTIILLIVMTQFVSCSTLRKSVVWGGVTGATIGATAGSAFSPDKYSRGANSMIFGGLGALVGAGLGWLFFSENPDNKELPSMILKESKPTSAEIAESETRIVPNESRIYKVKELELPENLKKKVQAPTVIEHLIPERQEKSGGKSVIIQEHKAWEVLYE